MNQTTSDKEPKQPQEILDRMAYFYKQTDGTYDFPNSAEGDLLKMVYKYLSGNPTATLKKKLLASLPSTKYPHTTNDHLHLTEPIIAETANLPSTVEPFINKGYNQALSDVTKSIEGVLEDDT